MQIQLANRVDQGDGGDQQDPDPVDDAGQPVGQVIHQHGLAFFVEAAGHRAFGNRWINIGGELAG